MTDDSRRQELEQLATEIAYHERAYRAGAPEITELDALDDGTRIETRHYAGCEGRGQVVLHTIEGGGHTWPGAGYVAGLGVASQELDASEMMWRFFAALP